MHVLGWGLIIDSEIKNFNAWPLAVFVLTQHGSKMVILGDYVWACVCAAAY